MEAVPIICVPPTTGKLQVTEERETAGTTVSATVWDTPLYEAVITTDLLLVTEVVVAVKVAEEEPEGIVTAAGTVTAALFDESVIAAPPAGAVPDQLTVHRLESFPATAAGEQLIEEKVSTPMTFTRVETVLPPELAVSVPVVPPELEEAMAV